MSEYCYKSFGPNDTTCYRKRGHRGPHSQKFDRDNRAAAQPSEAATGSTERQSRAIWSLAHKAKYLVEGMRQRVKRDPDEADYRAAFEPIVIEYGIAAQPLTPNAGEARRQALEEAAKEAIKYGTVEGHAIARRIRALAASTPAGPTPKPSKKECSGAPICNGPHGDEESCPVHGEEIRRARGKAGAAKEAGGDEHYDKPFESVEREGRTRLVLKRGNETMGVDVVEPSTLLYALTGFVHPDYRDLCDTVRFELEHAAPSRETQLREALERIAAQAEKFVDNRGLTEWNIRCYVCGAFSRNEHTEGKTDYHMAFDHKPDCPVEIARAAPGSR